ncbi:MAG TPA: FAD/NAD(P)-binding oxidoreductase [Ktedonobacterales bacterium]
MPQRILVLGGGVGGTIVANTVARELGSHEVDVTVIDATGQHAYMPGWLYVPFDQADGVLLSHDERSLLKRRVNLVVAQVAKIDPVNREVTLAPGPGQTRIDDLHGAAEAVLPYDYLVIGTGSRLAPEDLTGLAGTEGKWHDFYSYEGARRLRSALHNFEGGRLVIAVGGIPHRCPPAPLEFTFLVEDWLSRRGLRSKTEIQYLYPINRVFTMEPVAEMVTPLLDQRGIKYTTFFNTESVDTERKVISSLEGEEVPYDLLVMIPPHRGAQVIEDSGLGDTQGWIATDRNTLEVKGHDHVFALGDATDLPISKSGSAAHFEAKIVAARLIAAIRGEEPDPRSGTYDGEVMCFLETGHNAATQLVFNYERPPQPPHPSLYYHVEKTLFNRAYYHLVPQGRV